MINENFIEFGNNKTKTLGVSKTNKNGLTYEREVSVINLLKLDESHNQTKIYNCDYVIKFYNKNNTIIWFKKYGLKKFLKKEYNIILSKTDDDTHGILSKGIEPDEGIVDLNTKTVYIFEKKFQEVAGSVDEKIQTCDFKKKQVEKLFGPLGFKVRFIYILSDYFKKQEYTDVLNYIHDSGCEYYFNTVPCELLINKDQVVHNHQIYLKSSTPLPESLFEEKYNET